MPLRTIQKFLNCVKTIREKDENLKISKFIIDRLHLKYYSGKVRYVLTVILLVRKADIHEKINLSSFTTSLW